MKIGPDRYIGFKSEAADLEAECVRVQRWLAANGPIDLCILGLGTNGHVAMNEPGRALIPHPHVAKLTRSSQRHPMLNGLRRKPRFGLSLGIGDILRSRKILLLVSGSHKRAVFQRLMEPRITARFPASLVWLHPATRVLCEREAAGEWIGRK